MNGEPNATVRNLPRAASTARVSSQRRECPGELRRTATATPRSGDSLRSVYRTQADAGSRVASYRFPDRSFGPCGTTSAAPALAAVGRLTRSALRCRADEAPAKSTDRPRSLRLARDEPSRTWCRPPPASCAISTRRGLPLRTCQRSGWGFRLGALRRLETVFQPNATPAYSSLILGRDPRGVGQDGAVVAARARSRFAGRCARRGRISLRSTRKSVPRCGRRRRGFLSRSQRCRGDRCDEGATRSRRIREQLGVLQYSGRNRRAIARPSTHPRVWTRSISFRAGRRRSRPPSRSRGNTSLNSARTERRFIVGRRHSFHGNTLARSHSEATRRGTLCSSRCCLNASTSRLATPTATRRSSESV